ncbi:SanA protein [Nicoletella semolina]|uniref:SanA protein n=1 Tax=Nicoletella semolina TaxID=271160 RepID=A0A4R2N9A0_9PAST|nr:ElyC/SanA/YdcF family protein [Nicoletella semolina]MDH2925497.1 hypothetical protein [Nicoletella semolina]TCP17572.1 SanA protein [Nicoletella semolina]
MKYQAAKKILKKSLKYSVLFLIGLFGCMCVIDLGTSYLVRDKVYTDINTLPKRQYVIVLGTAKYYPSGSMNLYYKYRLNAAQLVFTHSKADYFLMSGDNKTAYYNEPRVMGRDLRAKGVPEKFILKDYAGYSTLDSIMRADKVFNLPPFTIISQRFHCERALLIAKFHDIDAICFVATYPEKHYQVRLREFIARSMMVLRLITGTEPSTLLNVEKK